MMKPSKRYRFGWFEDILRQRVHRPIIAEFADQLGVIHKRQVFADRPDKEELELLPPHTNRDLTFAGIVLALGEAGVYRSTCRLADLEVLGQLRDTV